MGNFVVLTRVAHAEKNDCRSIVWGQQHGWADARQFVHEDMVDFCCKAVCDDGDQVRDDPSQYCWR